MNQTRRLVVSTLVGLVLVQLDTSSCISVSPVIRADAGRANLDLLRPCVPTLSSNDRSTAASEAVTDAHDQDSVMLSSETITPPSSSSLSPLSTRRDLGENTVFVRENARSASKVGMQRLLPTFLSTIVALAMFPLELDQEAERRRSMPVKDNGSAAIGKCEAVRFNPHLLQRLLISHLTQQDSSTDWPFLDRKSLHPFSLPSATPSSGSTLLSLTLLPEILHHLQRVSKPNPTSGSSVNSTSLVSSRRMYCKSYWMKEARVRSGVAAWGTSLQGICMGGPKPGPLSKPGKG